MAIVRTKAYKYEPLVPVAPTYTFKLYLPILLSYCMMPGIFSLMRDIVNDSREIRLLFDTHGYTLTGLESSTLSQSNLHFPEVWAPAQYLIDEGLRPALARRLSSTYMDFAARYKETCQSHFDRATHGGHLAEHHREVFIILFKRTIQALGSYLVSIVRVWLCQAGASQATVRPERVDIRVDDATKAEIIARLGLKAGSPLISSTLRRHDPFSQVAPQTCFPAPYPPPPASNLTRNALPTSFIPPTRPRRSLAGNTPDMLTLTKLFGRVTTTTLEANSRIPRNHGVFFTCDSDRIQPLSPFLSPGVADSSTKLQLASVESIASPTKPTNTPRRRKIASLPTRRGKTSACPSLPGIEATSNTIPHPYEWVVTETPIDHTPTSPPKPLLVSTLPSPYNAEAPCFATPKSSTRQRKAHTLRKMLSQPQPIPQNQISKPLPTAGETLYSVSRSLPLVSDATSYFDSPPTSSDELDTPPSTPPSSRVLLASTSTESLAIGSEFDDIVSLSHNGKELRGAAKLPYPKLRYRRLDFTKGGLGRNEQPLTFTFSV